MSYPVLGMFRNTVEELSQDLALFIHRVIHGGGFQVQDRQGNQYNVQIEPQKGSSADIALLISSPRELDAQQRPKLPLLLRNELRRMHPSLQIFNPRGQNLETIPAVQVLCGLVLDCIDPLCRIQNQSNLPQVASDMFDTWRNRARTYRGSNPQPTTPRSLNQFVIAWQNRTPLGRRNWEREIPLIDLIYKLVTWLHAMQNDLESLVYLEAITRTINQASLFGHFGGQIIFDQHNQRLERASISEALWNIFTPIATGAIEINEELLETLPSDRVNIMSIHQSKGLEFPLVIVDVGSDFRTNHWAHAFKRFPRNGGKTCNMEDAVRSYSPLGAPNRPSRDRAFDDLIRLYFEAYSRAQDVLLLVGLTTVQDRIQHVATGWDRNGNWHWEQGLDNLVQI